MKGALHDFAATKEEPAQEQGWPDPDMACAALLDRGAVQLVQMALLINAVLLVLVVELLNSAVEATVDRISFDDHALAKRAKDIGSAAVLVSLVGCAVTWGLVLYDIFG